MSAARVETCCEELSIALEQLASLQEAVFEAISEKLDSMRRADVEAMIKASHREAELVRQIRATDGPRQGAIDGLSAALGIPGAGDVRGPRLSAIVSRIEGPASERLMRIGQTLRTKMLKVAEANRVVELVSREMLNHFRTLFAAIVRDDGELATYSSGGGINRATGCRVLDAVG